MLGAALTWLARCEDTARIDTALQPLACAVSGGRPGAAVEAVVEALQNTLGALPPGSTSLELLRVHRLLVAAGGSAGGGSEAMVVEAGDRGGGGHQQQQQQQGGMVEAEAGGEATGAAAAGEGGGGGEAAEGLQEAVAKLVRLPPEMQDTCLQLVCSAVPQLSPGRLGEASTQQLLEWLQSAEERLPRDEQQGEPQATTRGAIATARLALVRSLAASHLLAARAS